MTTDKQQSSARLGFIGMGAMGSRMAGRLLAAGYDLTVYNRERERTRMLEQRGAKVAATPRELASRADIILSSVADDAAVENVMIRAAGALATARPGTIFIEMSTVSPAMSLPPIVGWHGRDSLPRHRACQQPRGHWRIGNHAYALLSDE